MQQRPRVPGSHGAVGVGAARRRRVSLPIVRAASAAGDGGRVRGLLTNGIDWNREGTISYQFRRKDRGKNRMLCKQISKVENRQIDILDRSTKTLLLA